MNCWKLYNKNRARANNLIEFGYLSPKTFMGASLNVRAFCVHNILFVRVMGERILI